MCILVNLSSGFLSVLDPVEKRSWGQSSAVVWGIDDTTQNQCYSSFLFYEEIRMIALGILYPNGFKQSNVYGIKGIPCLFLDTLKFSVMVSQNIHLRFLMDIVLFHSVFIITNFILFRNWENPGCCSSNTLMGGC